MVNQELLETAIKNSGKQLGYLAEKMGCNIHTLKAKRNGDSKFTTDDVEILCRELNITSLRLKDDIFFAKGVDKSSTTKDVRD